MIKFSRRTLSHTDDCFLLSRAKIPKIIWENQNTPRESPFIYSCTCVRAWVLSTVVYRQFCHCVCPIYWHVQDRCTQTHVHVHTQVCVCVHLDLPLYIYTHPQEDLSVFRKSSPKQQGKNRPRILETRRKLLTNIRPEGLPDLNSRVKVHFLLAGPCKMTCNILTCQHN